MITKKEVLDNLSEVKKWIEESDKIVENKKINITIRHRYTGDIIWESEKTTYKEAVEEAIKSNADLSNADLSNADLSNSYLSNAYLYKTNLSNANLSNANLSNANLSFADLSNANLSNANLSFAELSNANLNGTLYYMGYGNRNFEALCKAIKTIKHNDGKFDNLVK